MAEGDTLPTALIVMGVAGSGKSTIGEALAQRLGWTYQDGDQFHPASNVAKMSASQPLTDEDRWPWLRAIADEINQARGVGRHVLLGCSALKRSYRDVLRDGHDDVRFIYLDGSKELIAERLGARQGHFMPPGLLDSQFKTLEPPSADEHPIVVSIDQPVDQVVSDVAAQLSAPQTSGATA